MLLDLAMGFVVVRISMRRVNRVINVVLIQIFKCILELIVQLKLMLVRIFSA